LAIAILIIVISTISLFLTGKVFVRNVRLYLVRPSISSTP
jgi:hypothetical protein